VSTWADTVREAYGDLATGPVEEGFGPVSVDVPADRWPAALALARDALGCTFFDWLSAVDEGDDGFRVVCHLAAHRPGSVDHLVVGTALPREAPVLASAAGVFAGARWHERETHEMFGIDFSDDGTVLALEPLLLPDEFEGHPLRKEFVLASRVARPWPGAKEPGESDASPRATRSRRRARPAGVPDREAWGPRDA
jgi:NADH-quinone oxidoreductase subunit C